MRTQEFRPSRRRGYPMSRYTRRRPSRIKDQAEYWYPGADKIQPIIDGTAAIFGLAGILGGALLIADNKPIEGFSIVALSVAMEITATWQMIGWEVRGSERTIYRSSRLSFSDSPSNSQPVLPTPDFSGYFNPSSGDDY